MKIKISVKQAGKKRPVIAPQLIIIDDITSSPNLRELISAVVNQQVKEFSQKREGKNLLDFLGPDQVKADAATGKVGFGAINNKNIVDGKQAVETALQAFEDGLFCVFADDEQINALKDSVILTPESIITFVRLTFLAGSFF